MYQQNVRKTRLRSTAKREVVADCIMGHGRTESLCCLPYSPPKGIRICDALLKRLELSTHNLFAEQAEFWRTQKGPKHAKGFEIKLSFLRLAPLRQLKILERQVRVGAFA